jgi:hypothetical protein
MLDETLWPICLKIFVIETQKCFPFVLLLLLHVAVNNIKLLNVAMETQELFLFALLLSYKTFPTAVNNINGPDNVPDMFVRC